MCTKNYDQMYSSWDMLHDGQTDRWTDRKKKLHIEVGAPPNKNIKQVSGIKVLNLMCEHFVWTLFCIFGLGQNLTLESFLLCLFVFF